MAKTTIKTLSPTQRKKRYQRASRICFFSEFLSIAAPFVTIGAVNYDKYFVEYNGTKTSIFFVMALAVMGIAIWSISKQKLKGSFVTLILGWAVVTFMCFMLGSLITDLAMIMFFGLFGILGAFGLDIASKNYKKKIDEINDAICTAQKDKLVKEVKQEDINIGGIL